MPAKDASTPYRQISRPNFHVMFSRLDLDSAIPGHSRITMTDRQTQGVHPEERKCVRGGLEALAHATRLKRGMSRIPLTCGAPRIT